MKPSIGKKIAIGYLIALPILLIFGLMQSQVLQNLTQIQQEAARATETLEAIETLVSSLRIAGTATEAGLSDKGGGIVSSREEARATTRDRLQHVKQLTAENPRQSERLSTLEMLVEKKLQSLERQFTPHAAGRPGAESTKTAETSGELLTEEIRKIASEMRAEELSVVRERSALAQSLADKTSYITTLWGILALWLIALAALLMYRKSSEQRWAGIERRMKARILESLPVGVCLTDDNGIILYSNRAEDALLGYKADELLGRYLANLESHTGEERERLAGEINDRLSAQGSWQGEFTAVRKDRSSFRCSTRAVGMESPGKLYRIFVQEDLSGDQRATQQ
jgi:PAS domain S-box-containing protein